MAKRSYDSEFKTKAIALVEEIGVSKTAKELKMPMATLNNWLRKKQSEPKADENMVESAEKIDQSAESMTEELAETEIQTIANSDDNDSHIEDTQDVMIESEQNETETESEDDSEQDAFDVIEDPQEISDQDENESDEEHAETDPVGDSAIIDETEDFYDGLCQDESIKRYFFIDYENVNRDGMAGILSLNSDDVVRIYYSDKSLTLSFGLHRRIMATSARIEYTKVLFQIKNAADCQILFEIRESAQTHPDTEYYIISKDTDFDKPIEILKKSGITLAKHRFICDCLNPPKESAITSSDTKQEEIIQTHMTPKEMQIRTIFGQRFKTEPYLTHKESIISLLMQATDKQTLNSDLLHLLANGMYVKEVISEFRSYFDALPFRANAKQSEAQKRKAQITEKYDAHFNVGEFKSKRNQILKILTESPSRAYLNNELLKLLKNGASVSKIQKHFSDEIKELPGSEKNT